MTDIWESIAQVDVGGIPRLAVRESRDRFDSPRRRLHFGLAAACALVVALGIAWFVAMDGSYSTGIGEQRIVNLDDGSRIHLNSDTTIDVDIGSTARRLQLERGEAFFEVAKDPARPFIVTAGDREVTALGTSFSVKFDQGHTAVTLVEGRVTVSEHGDGLILEAGDRVTFAEGGGPVLDQPRADAMAAWRRGEVVLNDTPLSEAAVEMNRYQRQQLVVEGDIGQLPISGIYRTGNNEDFANAVAVVYDLEVIRDRREIHLRAKR